MPPANGYPWNLMRAVPIWDAMLAFILFDTMEAEVCFTMQANYSAWNVADKL